jgi:teichuronic acid biosynthesis glycosyltransferase TuaC
MALQRRLLVISHMFPTSTEPLHGIWIKDQVEFLSKNYSVSVISPRPIVIKAKRWSKKYVAEKNQNSKKISAFFPVYFSLPYGVFQFLSSLSFLFFSCFYLFTRLDRKKIDLIDAHSIIPDGFASVLLGRLLKKPVIVTVHGSDLYKNSKSPWNRFLIRYTLRQSSAVIFVSKQLRDIAESLAPGFTAKYVVLPTGFDETKFQISSSSVARNTLGLPLHEKIVLFVGGLVKIKGLAYLIEAMSILKKNSNSIRCYIIGDGEQKQVLDSMIKKNLLQNQVFIVGPKPHNEIASWINASDLLVLPSLNEGLPTVVLEAFACGKPVVASAVGGLPEIIKNRENGFLFEPRNPESLAQNIMLALNLDWDFNKIQKSIQKYSWKSITKKLNIIYSSVIV